MNTITIFFKAKQSQEKKRRKYNRVIRKGALLQRKYHQHIAASRKLLKQEPLERATIEIKHRSVMLPNVTYKIYFFNAILYARRIIFRILFYYTD